MNVAQTVIQLYPQPARELPLMGLYLAHDLRAQANATGRTFVYTNYISSLDGRIAVPAAEGEDPSVPGQTANDRDWRLFQELAVQADIILTSGRYLRDYGEGRAQEILQVYDDPRFADLKEWRRAQGLSPQPDLAVISASLSFPIPQALTQGGRRVLVFTTADSDSTRRRALQDQLGQVLLAGEHSVRGGHMVSQLTQLGYRLAYNATGPKVNHLLLADSALDRLYLTLAGRLLGGEPFSTIVEGPPLEPAVGMTLRTVVYDPYALEGLGQLFLSYGVASQPEASQAMSR